MTSVPHCTLELSTSRSLSTRSCLLLSGGLVILGLVSLPLDVPLARLVQGDSAPTFLRKICGFAELFGHGVGVGCLLLVIAVLDPLRRAGLPRIAAASLGAGLVANLCKMLISRERPRSVNFELIDRSVDTFGTWLPLASNTSGGQGFPSSHMATAAALCLVLMACYPRGRWLFPLCAVLAGLQRILAEAHFASDVCWGAAVGCAIAPIFLHGPVGEAFDRLESRLNVRQSDSLARVDQTSAAASKSAA